MAANREFNDLFSGDKERDEEQWRAAPLPSEVRNRHNADNLPSCLHFISISRGRNFSMPLFTLRGRERKVQAAAHLLHLLGRNTGITPAGLGSPLSEPRRHERGESDGPLSAQSVV